jgi:predicted dehydrogenase
MAENFKVGIVGAGWIAQKAAVTLKDLDGIECYAIASRTLSKAQDFARQWGVTKAYGSYDELISDPSVDLVYVATPHSHHFDVTCQALRQGKPCLVEKAFMAN